MTALKSLHSFVPHNHKQYITKHIFPLFPLWQVSSKGKLQKPENQNQVDLSLEDHSPVEEVPLEQTRVYQNQPETQSPFNQNLSVQFSPHSTPQSPSEEKTQVNQNVKKRTGQNTSKPNDMDQNWIDEDQSIPTHRTHTNSGVDSNGAIWVSEVTEQPGFLFPVARTTTLPTIRRQITEEASLSVTPHQVVTD